MFIESEGHTGVSCIILSTFLYVGNIKILRKILIRALGNKE